MNRGLSRGGLPLATGRRATVLAALLAVALPSSAQTEESSLVLPGDTSPEGAEVTQAPPSRGQAPANVPFRIAGIVVGPAAKRAQVVILDPSGRPTKVRTVREGSTVEGYVIAAIEAKYVDVERDGIVFTLTIDNPSPIDSGAATPMPGAATPTPDAQDAADAPADVGDTGEPTPAESADAESPETDWKR